MVNTHLTSLFLLYQEWYMNMTHVSFIFQNHKDWSWLIISLHVIRHFSDIILLNSPAFCDPLEDRNVTVNKHFLRNGPERNTQWLLFSLLSGTAANYSASALSGLYRNKRHWAECNWLRWANTADPLEGILSAHPYCYVMSVKARSELRPVKGHANLL